MEPIIKWPGGKRLLAEEIIARMPRIKSRYFEPFAGGAAVAFALMERGVPASSMTITDVCRPLINTYQTIQNRPGLLVGILRSMAEQFERQGKDYYYRVREDINKALVNGRTEEPAVLAARFIFLNRTCYNGLWRVNSRGGFNTSFGRYKNPDIVREELIREASLRLATVRFLCAPYHIITTYMMEPGDVAYFDPPYYHGFTAYSPGGFSDEDQQALARTSRRLADKGIHVVVSNADCEEVRELYRGFYFYPIQARRSINNDPNGRGPVGELIITSEEVS